MKLPTIQRFQKQNYPGSPDWFTRFISDLNSFTEIVWNILNKNLTPADNLDAQVYTTQVLAGPASTDAAFQFQMTLNHPPSAVIIGNVLDLEAYQAALTVPVWCQWTISGTTIFITSITGLVDAHNYSITFVIL